MLGNIKRSRVCIYVGRHLLCPVLPLSTARAYDPTLIRGYTPLYMAQTLQYFPYSSHQHGCQTPPGLRSRRWCSCQTGGAAMGRRTLLGRMLSVVLVVGLWAAPWALAEEQPRRGGVLRVATAGDPPSL